MAWSPIGTAPQNMASASGCSEVDHDDLDHVAGQVGQIAVHVDLRADAPARPAGDRHRLRVQILPAGEVRVVLRRGRALHHRLRGLGGHLEPVHHRERSDREHGKPLVARSSCPGRRRRTPRSARSGAARDPNRAARGRTDRRRGSGRRPGTAAGRPGRLADSRPRVAGWSRSGRASGLRGRTVLGSESDCCRHRPRRLSWAAGRRSRSLLPPSTTRTETTAMMITTSRAATSAISGPARRRVRGCDVPGGGSAGLAVVTWDHDRPSQ